MILPEAQLYLEKYCDVNQKMNFKRLIEFKQFLENEKITDFKDVKRIHLTKYFANVINKRDLRKVTKSRIFSMIANYMIFLFENDLIPDKIEISKPKFTDFLSEQTINRAKTAYPKEEQIVKLLQHAFKVNFRMFIYLGIISANGMRDSECRTIMLNQINLEKKMIVSGIVENAAKEGMVIYYIPDALLPFLTKYIEELKLTYRDPKFLFHEPKSDQGYISYKSVYHDLQKYKRILKLDCKFGTHVFRHALNHYRFMQNCDQALLSILLYQQPEGTNAAYYMKILKDSPSEFYSFWKQYTWNLIPKIFT